MQIHGITVKLKVNTQVGVDEFNHPKYEITWKDVENVLIYPVSADDITTILSLTGKKVIYQLCIPKGNEDSWENTEVNINGSVYQTVGYCDEFIEDLVPGDWNKRIKVARYE